MVMVLLVLEKVIFLAALLPSSPHLYALLVPVPHMLRRDPIVCIIQVFPLVIKITNYNLVEMFCTFWVEFCWLCSTNFRVSLLKLAVPVLSNRFSWNFFSLRMKLCSRPWLSHWGSELTPLHNCVLLIGWQKLLLCTSTHPWIMAALFPVSKCWSWDLSTCKPWMPSVTCCTILHSPLPVWQPVEDSSVDLWQLQVVYLDVNFVVGVITTSVLVAHSWLMGLCSRHKEMLIEPHCRHVWSRCRCAWLHSRHVWLCLPIKAPTQHPSSYVTEAVFRISVSLQLYTKKMLLS